MIAYKTLTFSFNFRKRIDWNLFISLRMQELLLKTQRQKLVQPGVRLFSNVILDFFSNAADFFPGACHFHQFGHCLSVKSDLEWNGGSQWHKLPQKFEANPYGDAETFAIVRNPYDRVISYYYYLNRVQDMSYLNDRNRLNEFVLDELTKRGTGL